MIKIKLFGYLKQRVGIDEISFNLEKSVTLKELIESLKKSDERIESVLSQRSIVASINQEIADDDTMVNKGDLVFLMPPVSGG